MLRNEGLPARDVNVSEVPSSDLLCSRLRDELWFKGREWFMSRRCTMPRDEALAAELTSVTYSFAMNGKMVVESKPDMKKRGMRSPDLADAFLLTFAGGLKERVDPHRRTHKPKHSAWAS